MNNHQEVIGENYPRVTEIIKATEDPEKQKNLLKWMKKMEKIHGENGAEIERQKILDNGTALHTSIEKYLADEIEENPHHKFNTIKPVLNLVKQSERLIIEKRIYCHKYKFQGKPDLITHFEGLPTIIDWTTSQKTKKKQWIEHKFIQAGAYSIASELELNIKIAQLAVIVIVDKPNTFQIFTEPPKKWRVEFLRRLGQYKKMIKQPSKSVP